MTTFDYSGFIYVIVAAIAFVLIRIGADYVASSRFYTIEFEAKRETDTQKKLKPSELVEAIARAQCLNDKKRATEGLPVLVSDLSFEESTPSVDEVDYMLNRLVEAKMIVRYKDLIASAKDGEKSIGAYYIYEMAMKDNSYAISSDYKKMLKADNVVTLGMRQANELRGETYSYDLEGGRMLFLLSNGTVKYIEA